MKLEIDIPSILYQDAKENRNYISLTKSEIVWKAIADGKPIEQEPVLNKIRAEIGQRLGTHGYVSLYNRAIHDVLMIVDKYKVEEV